MTCNVIHTTKNNGTSILRVELDVFSSKCLHTLTSCPEDWIENIISSRCQPLCHKLWKCHIKECCENENIEKKMSKLELILGYEPEPDLIFEPKGKCVDNEDGSCIIEIEIDIMYTKKIQEILPNLPQEVRSIICNRIDKEVENIIDKMGDVEVHINKSKRDIVMEYQRENITEPEFEDALPYVDQIKEELDTTQAQLGDTQAQLQTTQTQLQTTQTQLQTTQTQLRDTQTQIDETRTQLDQTQAQLGQTQAQLGQTQTQLKETQAQLEETRNELSAEKAKTYQLQKRLELLEMSHAALINRIENL